MSNPGDNRDIHEQTSENLMSSLAAPAGSPAHSRLLLSACQFAVAKRLSNKLPNNGMAHGFMMEAHESLDAAAEEYFNAVVMGNSDYATNQSCIAITEPEKEPAPLPSGASPDK